MQNNLNSSTHAYDMITWVGLGQPRLFVMNCVALLLMNN